MEFTDAFAQDGFFLFRSFFTTNEVRELTGLILPAHEKWLELNREQAAVNSNYLTSTRYMTDAAIRHKTFQFLASAKIVQVAARLCPRGVHFLNTQLFFNPADAARKPYWHRDMQYLGVSEEVQQDILRRDVVLHFRIPFAEDPGLEFIPGSHQRWDSRLERAVRLEIDGHKNSEELPGMVRIAHSPGDLLIFSAHLIHRGSYGLERKSFDILYTDFPEKTGLVAALNHFPAENDLALFEHGEIFRTVQCGDDLKRSLL